MTARPAVLDGAGFAVTVPPSWFELDLAPATRDRSLRALVEERVREQPELREHRSTLVRLLRDHARQAWDDGARFCACMVEPTDEGPITASVTVSLVAGPLGVASGAPEQLDALLAPFVPRTARSDDDTWRRVAVVELADTSSAARAWGVEDVDLPQDAGWVRVVSLTQLVPLQDRPTVVLLSCSSPVVALADALLELFTAVADTLRVVRTAPGQEGVRTAPGGDGVRTAPGGVAAR